MTVWKIVRGAWTLVSLPFVAIATLNIERIAQAHRLDQIVPDPAQKIEPLSALAQQPWIVFLSVLIVGVTIGLWADSVLRHWARLMHRRSTALYEDALIAATAHVHQLIVVTRNTADFTEFGVPLLNPFLPSKA